MERTWVACGAAALLGLTACSGGGGGPVPIALEITPAAPTIALGTSLELTATARYDNGTVEDVSASVDWTTTNAAAVTLDPAANGLQRLVGMQVGTVEVHVELPGSEVQGMTTITVSPAVLVSLGVTPTNPAIALGYSHQFAATGIFSDDSVQDLTDQVTWLSTAETVAGVDAAGVATSRSTGTTTIRAIHAASSISSDTALSVTSATLIAITLSPTTPSFALGYDRQLTATGIYSDASTLDLTSQVTWTALDSGIATVSNANGTEGLAAGIAIGSTTITATHSGTGILGSTPLTVTPAVLVSLAVTPTDPSVALGYDQQFTATGTYSDATTLDLTDQVTWTTADAGVATVSNASGTRGLATSTATGTATITATHPGTGVFGDSALNVTSAVLVALAVTPTGPSVALGYDQQFTSIGTYSDATTADLTGVVTWTSSDAGIAAVSNASGTEGLTTSTATGTATITATHAGTGLSDGSTLTVTPAVLVSLAVTPTNPAIALGRDRQFTATGTYSDATNADLTSAVTWASSDTGMATISNASGTEGLAASAAIGSTTITATHSGTGIWDGTLLTVTPAVLVSLAVTPTSPSVALGYDQQFTATGTYSDATNADLTSAVTWASSDTGTATISNASGSKGLATSTATGSTTITATHAGSGIAGNTTLGVTSAVLVSLAVTPTTPSVALGYDQQFTATGTWSDATTADLTSAVTWSSSDSGIATASNASGTEGLATSTAAGAATITATDAGTGLSDGSALTVTSAVLVSLAVTPNGPSIALGYDQAFVATGTWSDSSTADLTSTVTWSSSDNGIATVSNASGTEGVATSTATGAATITATHAGTGLSDGSALTVTSAALVSLAVTPNAPAIALGYDRQFTATGFFSDASIQDLTSAVTWSSSDTGTATVSNASGTEGLATSIAAGSTTITATHAGTGLSDGDTLTITPAVLTAVAVTPTDPSIALGYDRQFTATGFFSDASNQDVTTAVTWSSSDAGTATISNASGTEGLAASTATGTATIIATHAGTGLSGNTTLNVTSAVLTAVAVTPTAPSIALGYDQPFVATGTYSDSSTLDLTSQVTWSSSDTGIATASNASGTEGLATSTATGSATITATHAGTGLSDGSTLTVTPAVLIAVAVTPTNPSVALGFDPQFTATGFFSDASNQDLTSAVTWSSSGTGIATVSNASGTEGLATSTATGATTITATHAGTGIAGNTTLTVTSAVLTALAVTPTTASVALGYDQQFAATGIYSDSSSADFTDAVTWASSNTGIATVSNASGTEGLTTSTATGVTTITATHPGTGILGSTTLTVTPAVLVSIAVTPTAPSIALGYDQQFAATGTYSDSSTLDLTTQVTWTSSTSGTATVSNASGSEGLATTVATGSTIITGTHSGTGIYGNTTLTVTPAALLSIAVTPPDLEVLAGSTRQLAATGTYSDSSTLDLTTQVTWTSSATGTATVSNAGGNEGLATGVAAGSSTITATHAGTGVFGTTTITALDEIAVRGAESASAGDAVLTLTIATPATAEVDDVLVAAIAVRPDTAVITPPSGWTLVRRLDNANSNSNSLAIYWHAVTASEPANHSWTFSTSTGSAGGIVAFVGVDPTDPVDVEDGLSTSDGLDHTAPDVTTTTNGAMLFTAHGYSSSETWTEPTGMTKQFEAASMTVGNEGGISLCGNSELRGAAGATGARTASVPGNGDVGNAAALALQRAP